MLFLHLSDIHFRKGVAGSDLDPDRTLRHEILLDVEAMCGALGAVDYILVSGDIAFAGDKDEFDYARKWIEELCEISKCALSNVFTCPGNHDAVRSVSNGPLIRALHEKIKATEDDYLDKVLKEYLEDDASSKLLFSPLSNYNNFAAPFQCSLSAPKRLRCERDVILNDGSILRLHGFNSALLSSASDKKNDLFVDPNCFHLLREPGIEHLVICHHPPEWLRQGQRLDDHLSEVCKIQLFGHEHTSRIRRDRHFLRVAAAATHPDRAERGWEPGYNLIEIEVSGTGSNRVLETRTHVRLWQDNPVRFRPKFDRDDEVVFHHSIQLSKWSAPKFDKAETLAVRAEASEGDSMANLREINLRFFRLTVSQRAAIAGRLGLLETEDADQPDYERYQRVFVRARERELINELETEVAAAENLSS